MVRSWLNEPLILLPTMLMTVVSFPLPLTNCDSPGLNGKGLGLIVNIWVCRHIAWVITRKQSQNLWDCMLCVITHSICTFDQYAINATVCCQCWQCESSICSVLLWSILSQVSHHLLNFQTACMTPLNMQADNRAETHTSFWEQSCHLWFTLRLVLANDSETEEGQTLITNSVSEHHQCVLVLNGAYLVTQKHKAHE